MVFNAYNQWSKGNKIGGETSVDMASRYRAALRADPELYAELQRLAAEVEEQAQLSISDNVKKTNAMVKLKRELDDVFVKHNISAFLVLSCDYSELESSYTIPIDEFRKLDLYHSLFINLDSTGTMRTTLADLKQHARLDLVHFVQARPRANVNVSVNQLFKTRNLDIDKMKTTKDRYTYLKRYMKHLYTGIKHYSF
jgi:hypothetical protein